MVPSPRSRQAVGDLHHYRGGREGRGLEGLPGLGYVFLSNRDGTARRFSESRIFSAVPPELAHLNSLSLHGGLELLEGFRLHVHGPLELPEC